MNELEGQKQITYQRLIALAALGVPLDPLATIRPFAWGLDTMNQNNSQVLALDALRLFNLYIEKSPYDQQWRVLFPRIVLDEIATEGNLLHNTPFWIALSKLQSSQAWDHGKLMERIAVGCIEMALVNSFGIEKASTLEEKFPFLRGSLVGKELASLSGEYPIRRFPKIKFSKGPGGVTPWNELSPEEIPEKESKLKIFFEEKSLIDWRPETIHVHRDDWPTLIDMANPEVLYLPGEKSASADVIYFTKEKNSVHFQFKAVQSSLKIREVIEEAEKVTPALIRGKKITLVIVALNVDSKSLKRPPALDLIPVMAESQLSFLYRSESVIDGWRIPENMDIVILTEKGVERLLTPYNVGLLKKGSQNLDDYLEGLAKEKSESVIN